MRRALLPILALLPLVPGCMDATQRKAAEDSGSIIAAWGPPTPAQAAAMMVDPYSPDKRYKGMTMIANAPWGGAPAYLTIYRDAIQNDTDTGVRAIAARALSFHGSAEDTRLIAPLLKDEDRRVRLEAARALQRLHNPEVIPDLSATLDPAREYEKDVRQAVASALGQYAEPRALAVLVAALNDDDLSVSRTARQSLRTLTGQDHGDDPKAWQTWIAAAPDPFARQTAYIYPTFHRGKYTWEHIPFFGEPPNEIPSTPAGYRPTKG